MAKRRAFGSIKVQKDRPGFYAVFHWDGRRYKRAISNRKVAARKLSAAHALLEGGTPIREVLAECFGDRSGSRMTFREAAPLYLEFAELHKKPSTFRGDVSRLKLLLRASWAGCYLTAITPADLTRWAEGRRAEGVSGATVNRDLALVSALYRWAVRMAYAEVNPARLVERYSEKGRERETYLTATEARALVGATSEVLRPLLVCALSTGMRRGELLALDWRDVDLSREEIVVRNDKAGRNKVVPMTADLAAELRRLRAARAVPQIDGTDPVFVLRDGSRFTRHSLRRLFTDALARCDAVGEVKRSKVTFHTLRHTAASLMVQADVSLPEVAKILGHSTLAVTMRYAHFAPEAGRAAVDRLGQALSLGDESGETGRSEVG